ncbi:B3 DNA binding domain - like 10 [Theobroma cacao]|nr:B3 DNA binding domain - like 10 [Theobroma cacao]
MLKLRRRPHFLNVFSSTSSANRLKIPVGFNRNLEGRTSGSVLLRGPSGYSWVVELVRKDDDLLFVEGWADFVRDHSVECGDFLVFRYDGDLVFDVKVFDQSSCEKEAAFHCKCSQGGSEYDRIVGQKRGREDGGVSLDQDCEGLVKRTRESSSEFDRDVADKEHCGYEPILAAKTRRGLASCDENNEGTILKTSGTEDLNLHGGGCTPMVAEFEEKKVAQSFNSSFPFFVRIMKRFNVSGSYTLNIPYQFAMEHLPKCKTEIVLRNLKGACWTVNSVPTTRVHTSHTLCGGWLGFVRSNEIKVGDICIFEFVRKFELRVHILRVGGEDPDRQSGKAVSNVLINRSDATLPKKFVKKSSKVHSKSMKKVQMCDNKGFKMLDKKKYGNAAKKSASVALCSLSRSGNEKQEAAIGGLRMMLALDEEKAAQSFASGFPSFVRIMRKFNVSGSYTLKIPYKFSKAYLPYCKTEVVLRNMQGKWWTVNSVPDSKGRAVHTFCGGWMAFVRDNDIKMGDICIFELVNKCEMYVHISGSGRKGLDHQHASTELLTLR